MSLSTHVLDTASGRPAAGVVVRVEAFTGDGWRPVATGTTDDNGRVADLLASETFERGEYRLTFEVGTYLGDDAFYPEIAVVFRVDSPHEHHHIPLLLSPFGYSTYRGS